MYFRNYVKKRPQLRSFFLCVKFAQLCRDLYNFIKYKQLFMEFNLNATIAAATITAMASIPAHANIDIEDLESSVLDFDESAKADAKDLMNAPLVRASFHHHFSQLVENLHAQNIKLSEIYASAPVMPRNEGNVGYFSTSNTLLNDMRTGTQNVAKGASFQKAVAMDTATCHSQCHSQCHSNHSSRGWR